MSDLVAFLTARIDEDEAAATQGGINGRRWDFTGTDCEVRVREPDGDLGDIVARCREGRAIDFSNTIHIALHDPARVLREVEAKRAILANLQSHEGALELRYSDVNRGAHLMLLDACQRLASVYSDHPGYQQEWV